MELAPNDPVSMFLDAPTEGLFVEPHLDLIAEQAEQADRTRSLSAELVTALKGTDVLRMSATREIGGVECTVGHIGRELEAITARCASTGWVLWNHLCVFHLFVGTLGPDHLDFLTEIVEAGEWVCFPAGAGSGVRGQVDGDHATINGPATWGSGIRYADYTGVVFAVTGPDGQPARPLDLRFTILPTTTEGLKIDPTWDGSSVKASATDHVHYTDVNVDLSRSVSWFGANRAESLRTCPVIHHRYREDWVGLSDLWLGWMAVGLVQAALAEGSASIRGRKALMGLQMETRPTVQVNLGHATALVAAARGSIASACREVDDRIEAGTVPNEADYLRQMAMVSMALNQLDEAMALLTRTLGGTSLREGGSFDRRARDFRAFPLHINAHQDRVTSQLGRHVLGQELEAF